MRECILTVQAIGIILFDLNLTAIAFKFNTGVGFFSERKIRQTLNAQETRFSFKEMCKKKNFFFVLRCRKKINKNLLDNQVDALQLTLYTYKGSLHKKI